MNHNCTTAEYLAKSGGRLVGRNTFLVTLEMRNFALTQKGYDAYHWSYGDLADLYLSIVTTSSTITFEDHIVQDLRTA